MTLLLFIAVIVLGVVAQRMSRRLASLEARIANLQTRSINPAVTVATADAVEPAEPAIIPTIELEPETEPQHEQAYAAPAPATIEAPALEPFVTAPAETYAPKRPPREPIRLGFEAIVGGKLPIWIGGAALVLAAFFLVRYSIENGLLGPVARTIIAGLFGIALIAASEVARRLPATRSDPRIGQALAGAGIASLYGTLYVGAQLYHLIGAVPAFIAMVVVTAGGLVLALRHGPPTAIMALIGGFAAPLISGFDAASVGPLLVYLGLLVAALFGLAIRRGWVWLALAACGGGFAWVNILIATINGRELAGAGGFVVLLAIGATMALPRTGATRQWLRLLPLVAGLVQLLILAPALDFGPLAWGLYLVLSAAALWLGWRDATLLPGGAASLVLVLALLAVALEQGDVTNAPRAAIAITLLFGVSGHLLARRGLYWAGIAIGATAGPVILVLALAHELLPTGAWAALLGLAALATAWLSWRDRDQAQPTFRLSAGFTGGAAIAALLCGLAETELLDAPWRWPAWLAIGVVLAAWSRRTRDRTIDLLVLAPLIVTVLAMAIDVDQLSAYILSIATKAPLPPLADLAAIGFLPVLLLAASWWLMLPGKPRLVVGWIALAIGLAFIPAVLPAPWHSAGLGLATAALILFRLPIKGAAVAAGFVTLVFVLPLTAELMIMAGTSLGGERLPWLDLPPLLRILRELTLPAALMGAALLRQRDMKGPWRPRAIAVLAAIAGVTLYALCKTPLAIDTLPRFEALGLLERVAITQILFAAAWTVAKRQADIARVLLVLALGRFLWFDLLILDPVIVRQSVGSVPVLNLATLDAALTAAWLWPYRANRYWHMAMLGIVLIAVAATVRQIMHGDMLTGGMSRTENWLYSAALLGLALVWLAQGIRTGAGDLRIAGLALLTAVTLKVFLIDAAALEGILRILSFLGLGLALIGIGWAYGRVAAPAQPGTEAESG